ncbi:gp19, partial [Salmonella enterica subsp. enterica serovar Muenchen str. baa1594]
GETVDQAAGAMQKSQNGGDIPDKDLFVRQIGAALALSGGVAIGGDSNPWTTAEFIAWLESCGAFNHPYWMCKGSWDYAGNKVITDTGCGNICLAGAVIEVMGTRGAMTIRITTPTTTSGEGVPSAQFTYINHGDGYAPGWRREFSRTGDEMTGNLYLKNDGRVNFCIMNEDGTPRMWIFKDKGSDGIHINNGNDGGGDFIFGKDGNFRAGAAIYANNGDVFGTAWGGGNAAWLSNYLYLNMVKAIRLGPVALSGGLWRDFQLGGGQVVTGFHTDGDWEMQGGDDKVYYRPIQYLIGTRWVTAPSV